jgi:hypothetical protein
MLKVIAVWAVLLGAAMAWSDEGDRLDQCRLDRSGALHCSTPNRRSAAAMKAVLDMVSGFDRDERTEEVRNIVQVWFDAQKGPCKDESFYVSDIMNAYSYPGLDPGEGIEKLTGCAKEFATWLFKKENHGLPPGTVAWANTVMLQDREDVKQVKGCTKEVKALLAAGKAWLAAEKATVATTRDGEWPSKPQYDARKAAVAALNACLEQ